MSNRFELVEFADLPEVMINGDFDVVKINHTFDFDKYKTLAVDSLQEHPAIVKDNEPTYKALGLQYGDEANPYYDAVNRLRFITPEKGELIETEAKPRNAKAMIKLNSVGLQFSEIFKKLNEFLIPSRSRLVIAEPGHRQVEHSDGFCCGAFHFPIQTNEQAEIFVRKKAYHLPADGSCYLLNAGPPHHAENNGDVARIHLTIPFSPLAVRRMSSKLFEKTAPFRKQFNYNQSHFVATQFID